LKTTRATARAFSRFGFSAASFGYAAASVNEKRRPLPALTGLRFFLATWVIIFHAIPTSTSLEIAWLPGVPASIDCLVSTGYVAVTIFFALSGFVLAYNYDLGKIWNMSERKRFGVARFARIYPAYFVALALLAPLAAYRLWSGIPLGEYSISAGFLNLLLVQAWFPQTALTWNFPGWSLSGEAFFYASFFWVGHRLWKLERRGAMIASLGGLWILSLTPPLAAVLIPISGFGDVAAAGGVLSGGEPWVSLISYNPLAGLPAFCSGIVLARLYQSLPAGSAWFGRGDWLVLPALVATLLVLGNADRIPLPLVHNGLLLPAYLALIFGLALGGGMIPRMLAITPLVFLGNASYAMYILHFPVAEWFLLARKFLHYPLEFSSLGWVVFYVVLVVAGSSFFYRFAEERLHQKLRVSLTRWLDPRVEAKPQV
jgi:peptidoglycan/LPS O-acetylase OafA/YrhL